VMVQRIRKGGSLPSCTSKVLTSGTVVVERQYASNVSWSQFWGTPLLSGVDARVSESRTVMRMLFVTAAFPHIATSKRNACTAATLHMLTDPTPPNTAGATVAEPIFPNDSGSEASQIRYIVLPWRVPHNNFPVGRA
jgi:hypothetical protein